MKIVSSTNLDGTKKRLIISMANMIFYYFHFDSKKATNWMFSFNKLQLTASSEEHSSILISVMLRLNNLS